MDGPPVLALGRAPRWGNQPITERVSILKERLGRALSRNKLTAQERDQLHRALNRLVDAPIDDYYVIPPILTIVEEIPLNANRVIGNGGSRTRRMRKKKRTLRKRTHRK